MTQEYPYALRPIFNRVLIKRDTTQEKSAGGIILHTKDPKINAPSMGTVLDVGTECDPPVQELKGKRVMFSRFAGDWIKIPNVADEYFICSDEDILGEIYV